MRTNQRGFGAIEVVVVLVIIGLIGGVGWYAWQSKHKDKSKQTDTTQTAKEETATLDTRKTFDCNGVFTIKYADSLQATLTTSDPPQCLIANVSSEDMPSVGALPPEQLGLFFSTSKTALATNKDYLNDQIEKSKQSYVLQLKGQEELKLDNGKSAMLATIYGGHPEPHDYYYFVYLKNDTAITTSFPINSDHKDLALSTLKSIQ
jgi:prepilin-type N-terminal cleavage/methylation domain-containing protein